MNKWPFTDLIKEMNKWLSTAIGHKLPFNHTLTIQLNAIILTYNQ